MATVFGLLLKAVTARLLELPATALVAANVARCESSSHYDDGAAVVATAMTRARAMKQSLFSVLTTPHQFAWRCPLHPRTWDWRHLQIGFAATVGSLRVPVWTKRALHYCHLEPAGTCEAWCAGGCVPVGRLVHTFYGRRSGG